MIVALKIILILIMCISFMGAIADGDKEFQKRMTAISLASIFATVAAFIWI